MSDELVLQTSDKRPWWHHALLFALGTVLFTVPYVVTNELSAQRPHHYRFYFDWELEHIPFVAWMIIPYVATYLVPLLTIRKLAWHENKALVWSIGICGLLGGIFFLFFPTVLGFKRDLDAAGVWAPLYELLWTADRPHNLCPSMHVVMAYLLIVPMLGKFEHWGPRLSLLGALASICLSILLVHQHHVMDLVAGLEMGILAHVYLYLPLRQRFAPVILQDRVTPVTVSAPSHNDDLVA